MEIINLERKNEYTTHLTNLLSPIMYDGINSIYIEGKNISKNNGDELKVFQSLLKSIPDWEKNIIEQEVNRIKISSKCDYLDNLVKAVIKSNIEILMNNKTIDNDLYNIDLSSFIHNCYITLAKAFYQYPDLFYHKNKSIDIKRNQRESIQIIKEEIKNTIRKMIPLNLILDNYINLEESQKNVVIENNQNEIKQTNLSNQNNLNNSIRNMVNSEIECGNVEAIVENNQNILSNSISYTNQNMSSNYSKTNTKSYTNTQTMTNNSSSVSPKLVSESVKKNIDNSLNTSNIIKKIKNNNTEVLSSEVNSNNIKTIKNNKNNNSIKTIENDTSISYNIEEDNTNLITAYKG